MPAFPHSLCAIRFGDHAEQPSPVVVRSDVERGIPRQRRIAADSLVAVPCTFLFKSKAESAGFEAWFFGEALAGGGWFDFTLPRTGQVVTAQVRNGDIGALKPRSPDWEWSERSVVLEYVRPGFRALPPGLHSVTPSQVLQVQRASTATFVDAGGVLQTAAAHVARFQGGQLLVEGAATNCALGTDSDALTTWSSYVTGAGAVTRQVVADPQFGNVLRLTKTSGAEGDRAGVTGFGLLAGMSGTSYVLSCWVRRSADALGHVYADANRLTGGLITAATLLSGAPAGQWTRLSAVGSNALGLAGGGTPYVWLDGPVGSTVDIKLPNVTLGTVLSSAFPAGAAPASRAADIITVAA